ncbi:peptidoglycan DD-metalloendopeptidase family protein [Streptomyces sp. NPDC058280]|uniref:aggregation-promoting factor C-terminal-like domain-containing protein n=1 Tax=Streptomyces sp. NPDC058280 TaxID=3346419 RepID=UPI0036F0EA18
MTSPAVVGTAAVDVVPIIPNFHNKLKALVLPIADRVGEEAGKRMGQAISDNIVIAIPSAINQGGKAGVRAAGKQGDDAGGAFARSIRRKLEAAFKAMPKLDVKLGDTGVDAELARIRAKLEQLSNRRIGIDVSAEAAEAEVARLEERLRELGAQHPNIAVRADTATARAALAAIRAEIASIPGRREVGIEVDGAFGAKLRAVVAEAQASIPDINVDADTSPARAEVQRIRGELAALADARVGIDIDAGEALAKIAHLQERLAVLSLKGVDIDVRVDAAAAAAQLAALQRMADDNKIFHIKALADTSGASSALLGLTVQAAALVAIPLGPVLAAGLGAVVSMAAAATAGVGALALAAIPAIKGVSEALKAKSAAEDDAAKATARGATANVQASQRAIQMAGAQDALSAAHRNAARSIAQANRGVEDAERAVAQAAQRAADQRRQAAESVARAERSLSDAKRAARVAEQDLTQARRDAAAQLADLQDRLIDGALSERDATLRVQEAQDDLNRARADADAGKATDLQVQRAQLAYEQAVQNAAEQKKSVSELRKQEADARKAGISGSAGVKRAADALAAAQRNVQDETKAVADAHRASARAQVDAAQTVADAQLGLSDAVQAAADAQVSAAESIESAERGLASARLSAVGATSNAISKQEEYRQALGKLSPAQRELYDSIAGPAGLKQAFDAWQKSLQPETLPIFTRSVDAAKNSLPGLRPLVLGAADGIGVLFDKASKEMKSPFWQGFKDDIAQNAGPAIIGLGTAIGNVFKGAAGVVDAFLPHMDGIVSRSDRITGRFAKWGTSLKGSPDFERFLDYVKTTAPGLADFLGEILTTAMEVSKALAPLSERMFEVLTPVLDAIQWLSTNAPGFIQLLWGIYFAQKAIALGMAAFAGAMILYETVIAGATLVTSGWAVAINATGIVPVIRAIVLVVALLIAGLVYAYKNWDWFRAAVDGAVKGVSIAASWLWNTILKPVFSAIWTGLKAAGQAAMWLWNNALGPAFGFIGKAAQFLFTLLVTLLLLPAYAAFKAVGAIGKWLWEKVLGPVFSWIGERAKWLWDKALRPAMASSKKSLEDLGAIAKWLWHNVVSPVFGWIGDKAAWLYNKAVKPAFDKLKSAVKSVSDSFNSGKDSIKKAWNQIEGIAKKPVKFVVDHVYNKAIVPLWNAVAKVTGADNLKKLDIDGYHTGGVMSGYSPGRDDRIIAVGGGEAVMRPEWTRAIGADRINSWNAAARSGGISGVQRAISAGMPAFKDGGVVGWLKDKGNAVGDFFSGAADFLDPTKVFGKATGFIKDQLKSITTNPWSKEIAKIPLEMMSSLKDSALNLIGFGGGDGGGQWIKPVNVPYGTPFGKKGSMWSSGRHTGLDFPAAVGTAIKAVAAGRVSMAQGGGPYGNHVMINHGGGLASLYAHMSQIMTSVGKSVTQGQGIGRVGATGNVTGPHLHLEARRNGVSVDPMTYLTGGGGFSGKAVGSAQTYAKNMLGSFGWGPNQFGPLQKLWHGESGWRWDARNPSSGAYGIPQALPASKMSSAGPDWLTNPATQIRWGLQYIKSRPDYGSPAAAYSKWLGRSPHWYDDGGYLPPGLSLVANGTGKPEPVFTSAQWDTLRASAGRESTPTQLHADVHVYVGDREITDIVDTRIDLYDAEVADGLTTGRRYI